MKRFVLSIFWLQ